MRIDVHTAFMPQKFYETARKGREWYGARIEKNAEGQEIMALKGAKWPLPPELNIGASPEQRIRIRKEQEGIDIQVVSIAGRCWNYYWDTKTGASYCREINEELAELQQMYPTNFVGLAMLPLQDTNTALKELDYATKNLGLRAMCVGTNVNGQNLDDPGLFPVLEAAASEGLFIFCHPTGLSMVGDDRMPRYNFRQGIGLLAETTLAIGSLIFGGVLDRCPNMKICFSHGGGYISFGIGRLAHWYHAVPESHTMERSPEEYLSQIYYDCLTQDANSLRFLVERVSASQVLLGTDFPFTGGVIGGTVNWLEKMPFLAEGDKQKIFGENAARLLGILTT